mgnify:CR=1 FL=1
MLLIKIFIKKSVNTKPKLVSEEKHPIYIGSTNLAKNKCTIYMPNEILPKYANFLQILLSAFNDCIAKPMKNKEPSKAAIYL